MTVLQENMTVVSQCEIARDIFELVLTGDLVQNLNKAGQFLNIKIPNDAMLLRRPISLSSWNKAERVCTILYRIGDEISGTRILSKLVAGETVDVMGPLGNGFDISEVIEGEDIVIVGGGIGVPPLYELAKQLNQIGCKITVLLGFSSVNVKILEEEFSNLSNVDLRITTDDGSYGAYGHVGLLMNSLDFTPHAVYSCGSSVMLQAVAHKYEDLDRLYVSLESRMACGIGACYACVVRDREDENHALKICEDGPVFSGREIIL